MKRLIQLFKALSDEARVRILNLILETGELCVCDLQRVLGFTQTKVSRHLAYLKHSGILEDRRLGGWMIYRLANQDDPAAKLLFKELRDLFKDEAVLKKDLEELHQSIEQGCCVSVRNIVNISNRAELTN
jgi:ArsR family transcriptional regulator